jgi:hypothetical protein
MQSLSPVEPRTCSGGCVSREAEIIAWYLL